MAKFLGNLICLSSIILAFYCLASASSISNDSRSKSIAPPSILRSHGPDAFGYYYYDSDDSASNAPIYNWIDISSRGTEVDSMSDDRTRGPYPIGFNFSYYGSIYSNFRVCSNGYLSFTSSIVGYSNSGLPSSLEPNNTLAVFWDDLAPDSLSHAYYYSNNRDTLIVAWHNYYRYIGEGRYTFEAILTANGNITYQYQSLNGTLDSHTIGIENITGTIGLEYIYNFQSDETGRAILFSQTPPDYGRHNILIIAADSASHYINAMSSFSDMGIIDFFDAHAATPTLSQLQSYDAVVVWSNLQFFNATALGIVLADYLDWGGAVVLHQFCFGNGWEIGGRLMSQYSPFTAGEISTHRRYMGVYDAGHPLMAGVDSLSDGLTASVQLQHSPILVASYIDGTPLIAYNPLKKLVAINGYAGDTLQFTGDMFKLSHNAINFAIDGAPQILIVAADDAQMAKRELSTFPNINSIHLYDARLTTPSVQMLSTYQAVVVWGDQAFSDPVAVGNNLADYIDGGADRGVVLMQFCFGQTGRLQGRIMSSYSPFAAGNIQYATRTLGWHNDNNPLMDSVSNITDYFASNVSLQNGGELVARWDDNIPFVAYNPNNNLVAINGYIGDTRQFTGDMVGLTYNAILFSQDRLNAIDDNPILPSAFELYQNYPNPFNPTTTIAFDLPSKSDVLIEIINILGQKVAVLPQGILDTGRHTVSLNAESFSSGLYFYKLSAGDHSKIKKMTVLK